VLFNLHWHPKKTILQQFDRIGINPRHFLLRLPFRD
jgi:hypothetical protein